MLHSSNFQIINKTNSAKFLLIISTHGVASGTGEAVVLVQTGALTRVREIQESIWATVFYSKQLIVSFRILLIQVHCMTLTVDQG